MGHNKLLKHEYETIFICRPEIYEQVIDMNLDEKYTYNYHRLNQPEVVATSRQPPRLAYCGLPALSPVSEVIDRDRWLETIDLAFICKQAASARRLYLRKQWKYLPLTV